ncbi:hypothetical protein PR048_018776 [Dryococelus australis]|uniref:Uncharacterized protein n=1 Tax=Dryococelus australis TaxID=614101 RepID=A0ABQ9HD99_9NEOP|nr:hypothetical protein PR048_018776 [Dryococelus australis]
MKEVEKEKLFLEKCEENLVVLWNEVKEKIILADKWFFEAQKRLTAAAEAKNLQEVGLAHGMFVWVAAYHKEE